MHPWTDAEYEALFRDHPPTQPTAPTSAECAELGRTLGRSKGAIQAQWNDGRSLVLGNATAASRPLRDYMVRRGWL